MAAWGALKCFPYNTEIFVSPWILMLPAVSHHLVLCPHRRMPLGLKQKRVNTTWLRSSSEAQWGSSWAAALTWSDPGCRHNLRAQTQPPSSIHSEQSSSSLQHMSTWAAWAWLTYHATATRAKHRQRLQGGSLASRRDQDALTAAVRSDLWSSRGRGGQISGATREDVLKYKGKGWLRCRKLTD